MANMFDNICSSSYSPMSHEPSDDISVLLRQILSKSSSSSSSSSLLTKQQQQQQPHSAGVANVEVNVGAIDYDHSDEYDCESQEGFENLMEEMDGKPNPPRNPSKRMRAAEVHNMSEKRRRSRINEKMKALQKLIPNSNKTDKASMLDEAIEYLKQLQLQVQMLTMRNGINLYSMYAPHGGVQPNHRPSNVNQGNHSINMAMNQERLVNLMLGHPIQCMSQNKQSILDFPRTIHQEPPFGTQLGSS